MTIAAPVVRAAAAPRRGGRPNLGLLFAATSSALPAAIEHSADARTYLDEVTACARLAPGEAQRLAGAVRSGSTASRLAARNRLVEANLLLSVKIASHIAWTSDVLLDLIQEGNLGLIDAAERYDGRGAFSTYAVWHIRQRMQRWCMAHAQVMRVPAHVWDAIPRVRTWRDEHADADGQLPSAAATADALGVSLGLVESVLARRTRVPLSLSIDDEDPDGEELGARLVTDPAAEDVAEGALSAALFRQVWARAEDVLSPRERLVLALRFGLAAVPLEHAIRGVPAASWPAETRAQHPSRGPGGRTTAAYSLRECGEVLGLTRERVRQIEARALRVLRETLGETLLADATATAEDQAEDQAEDER